MAEPFQIYVTESAQDDLRSFEAYTQRLIVNGIEVHLRHQPTVGSRRIKAMRPNLVAGWELRLGSYRVLYDVDEMNPVVTVQVIGEKRGNRLFVQGQEFTEHESH